MTEPSMLGSLFDDDMNLMGDLAGIGGEFPPQTGQQMQPMVPPPPHAAAGGLGMPPHLAQGEQMLVQQSHPSFAQLQAPQPSPQKLQHYGDYSQYSQQQQQQQKLHHMNQQGMMGSPQHSQQVLSPRHHAMASAQPRMPSPHQYPQGIPQQQVQRTDPRFQAYAMQRGMMQPGMNGGGAPVSHQPVWPGQQQGQPRPPAQPYNGLPGQQLPGQHPGVQHPGMTPYISHHDYALQPQQQRLHHYPQATPGAQQIRPGLPTQDPYMGGTSRLTHMPNTQHIPGTTGGPPTPNRQRHPSATPHYPPTSQQMSPMRQALSQPTSQPVPASYPQGQHPAMRDLNAFSPTHATQVGGDQRQRNNSGQMNINVNTSMNKLQHYPYPSQEPSHPAMAPNMIQGEAPRLSHFPENGQGRQEAFLHQYPGMRAPTPTSMPPAGQHAYPPQSMAVSAQDPAAHKQQNVPTSAPYPFPSGPPTSQGYSQGVVPRPTQAPSSLQQLEQLIPPQTQAAQSTHAPPTQPGNFPPMEQTVPASSATHNPPQPFNTNPEFQQQQQQSHTNSPGNPNMTSVHFELQQLSQQLQFEYNLPPHQRNPEKIGHLQERVRVLQGQLHAGQQQQQAQQQAQQQQQQAQQQFAQLTPPPSSQPDNDNMDDEDRQRLTKAQQAQEKAARICAEAMHKAKQSGNPDIPRVVTPPGLPPGMSSQLESMNSKPSTPNPKEKEKKKKPPAKSSSKSKSSKSKAKVVKMPPATLFKGKKRKRKDDSDGSDLDATPPPSPSAEDSLVEKRRSTRNVKRKTYVDDFHLSGDEEETVVDVTGGGGDVTFQQPIPFYVENPNEDDAVIVEKILTHRVTKNEHTTEEGKPDGIEQYYVKYKNFSYLHCEWKTVAELEKDKRIHQKIKRFWAKRTTMNMFDQFDDEPFNPDYVEVDRVLDMATNTDPNNGQPVTHYLVKWQALPYEDSTWELEEDIDTNKLEQYHYFKQPPPPEDREAKPRPAQEAWHQLDPNVTYKNDNKLREYQMEGVNWLLFNWYNRRNCILADEMGLGKTVQSITFLKEVQEQGIMGPFLIIAPLSTIANWQREFETWTNINVVVYHGSSASRQMIHRYEMFYVDEVGAVIPECYKFQALITTYEVIISDCLELREIPWRAVIIDEAHRLKNRNCKLLEGLKILDLEHRVLLTGTPLQNNVEELFSLLNFLEPDQFDSEADFLSEFGDLKTEDQVSKLQALLKPMMLRRLKEDVEKNLAPKEETIIEVELTNIQKKYYRAILERNFTFLAKGCGSSSNVPNLMNTMMELRKCCNHPYLINGAEEKILGEYKDQHGENHGKYLHCMVQASGKLVLIDKLLPKLRAGGHKVLIFSQMVRCLDILEDYLVQNLHPYERIDGRVRGNLRQAAIDRFSKPDSDRFVFLLCTRAGGLGINLTAADTVIIFDSDWNPQNDLQAQARCHRIGQSKSVKVYRLLTRNTYERDMFDRASMKLGLDRAVLQSMRDNVTGARETQQQQQLSKKEIEELLKKGAYGALMDEDDSDKFCEEDIEQILQRRTQVITIESEGKGSTFAKASFVSRENRTDINIDDPDFWKKWAKKADLDMEELNRDDRIIEMPRVRKQTKRYATSATDDMLDFSDSDTIESDAESEGGSRKKGKKSKGMPTLRSGHGSGWTRVECFRVEKNLLVYGWGRWSDILRTGRFKRTLSEQEVESIARTMLMHCLQHYKGDEKIKAFIWDLITPPVDGAVKSYKNHLGLSAPVPRGRKGKKKKDSKALPAAQAMEWAQKINTEELLTDPGYKRHLQHHCNKVLLRVRMLYYLKQEVIGDQAASIWAGTNHANLDIQVPIPEGEPPIGWWDEEADKSLLIGVFKHGYEKYNFIRADPALCFLSRCGPPDGKVMAAEQAQEDADVDDVGYNDDDQDPEYKPKRKPYQDDEDDSDPDSLAYGDDDDDEFPRKTRRRRQQIAETTEPTANDGKLPFPTPSDMNTRLRRIITSYQRSHKKQQLKAAMREKKEQLRKERFEEAIRQKELRRREMAQRWSRREEADFYRVVSTFGVEFDRTKQKYLWDRFRSIARLDKKYDQNMTEYYLAFRAMCERVCGRRRKGDEDQQLQNLYVEPITEERASRCLFRIDLLRKVREEVLPHAQMDERIKLCLPSHDLPDWWECGKHDRDLLIGFSRHGVSRTEYHILGDPTLSFAEVYKKHSQSRLASIPVAQQLPPNPAHLPVLVTKETKDTPSLPNGLSALTSLSPPILKPELPPTLTKMDDLSPKAEPQEDTMEDAKPATFSMNLNIKKETDIKTEVKTEDIKPFLKEEVKEETESKPSMSILERELAKTEDANDLSSPLKQELPKQGKEESMSLLEQELARPEKEESSSLLERELAKPLEMEVLGLKGEEDSLSSAPLLRPVYQDGEDSQHSFSMDGMGEPTVAQLLSQMQQLRWPKDKVLIQRVDHISQAVLNGKWPVTRRIIIEPLTPITPRSLDSGAENSGAATPLGSGTEGIDSTPGDAGRFIVRRRKRRKRAEIEADKEAKRRLADMMYEEMRRKMQQASAGTLPSDDQPQDLSMPRSTSFDSAASLAVSKNALLKSQDSLLRSPGSLPVMAHKALPASSAHDGLALSLAGLVNGVEVPVKKRRGRKPKHDKEEKPKKTKIIINENGEAIEVEVKRRRRKRKHKEETWSPSRLGPDVPIPVINKVKGERLSGLAAPLNCDLLDWLKEHPGWEVDYPPPPSPPQDGVVPHTDMEGLPKLKKKRHRCPNPNKLDPDNLTGEERVMVVNRKTGKKIGGLAAPQLMDLDEWLNKNPGFDIAADWEHIAKKYLPVDQHHRIQKNSGKTDSAVTAPFPQQPFGGLMAASRDMALPAGMAGLAGLSAMAPFPGLPGMAMPTMFGFGGLGLPLPATSTSTTSPSKETSPKNEKASSSSTVAAATGTSATSTAGALPTPLVIPGQQGLFWPNPFMMNPAFLPGFLHAGLANGIAGQNVEEQDSLGSLSPQSVKSEGTRSAPSEPVSPSSASPSKTVTERTNGDNENSNNNNSNVVSEDTLSPQEQEELNSAETST